MNKISEEDIERFIRFPGTLSEKQKEQVESALSEDSELRQLADWFKGFYKEIDALMPGKVSKSVIPLYPIEEKGKHGNSTHLVFAAMTKAPQRTSMQTIATLASEEDKIVARVLRHRDKNEYRVHLIRREQPEENENSIFTIDELNMDLVLDHSRHLSFQGNDRLKELDWEHTSCSLRIPVGTYNLGQKELKQGTKKTLQIGEQQVTVQWEEGTLKFHLNQSGEAKPELSRLLVSHDDSSTLLRLNGSSDYSLSLEYVDSLTIQFFS